MTTRLLFTDDPAELAACESLAVMGRRADLAGGRAAPFLPADLHPDLWGAMLGTGDPGEGGRATSTWLADPVRRLTVAQLPEACSRHNAPSRALAIPGLVRAFARRGRLGLVCLLAEADHALGTALGIARALPAYTARSEREEELVVLLVGPDGVVPSARVAEIAAAARRAAAWVDMPPDELHVPQLVAAAQAVAAGASGVHLHVVRGEQLREQGLGGLYGVGRAAVEPPALVVLDWDPPGATGPATAWVGKGIVFDTGGLSIKAKTAMPGMKDDMAGAGAVLAAFEAAVRLGVKRRLTAVLCLAENAIGPGAIRPDDILHLLSGKRVEINNTDAEGRLVLADVIIDIATLTGAQMIATGRRTAAIVSNDGALEAEAVAAGLRSGDLVHPLPYQPELLSAEFASPVADMRNSVKDRNNAQSSCAAQFIASHLGEFRGGWLHVDMAGPAVSGGVGTGFGVGLLLAHLGAA